MLFFSVPTKKFVGVRALLASVLFWRSFLLYVFVILRHDRREVVYLNVTQNPTDQWTAQQIVEALTFDTRPRHLLRDRDGIYGECFRRRVKSLGV